MKLRQKLIALSVLPMLAGCGASTTAVSNPNFFSYKISDGVISGAYNPAGYTSNSVKKLLNSDCKGGALASWSEGAPGENGLVPFKASCKGGTKFSSGNFEAEKTSDNNVIVEGTGSS